MNMKTYKRAFVVLAASIFIIPQIAFAAWWNPFSWGIFSLIFGHNTDVPAQTAAISTADIAAIVASTTSRQSPNPINKPPQIQSVAPVNPSPQPPPNTTFCNGKYWNQCFSNSTFVCPKTGDAYCQAPPSTEAVPPVPQPAAVNAPYIPPVKRWADGTPITQDQINNLIAQKQQSIVTIQGQIQSIENTKENDSTALNNCESQLSAIPLDFVQGQEQVQRQYKISTLTAQCEYLGNKLQLDETDLKNAQQRLNTAEAIAIPSLY